MQVCQIVSYNIFERTGFKIILNSISKIPQIAINVHDTIVCDKK